MKIVINGETIEIPSGVGSGVQSPNIDTILVMDRAEYLALPSKDPRTVYLLRG